MIRLRPLLIVGCIAAILLASTSGCGEAPTRPDDSEAPDRSLREAPEAAPETLVGCPASFETWRKALREARERGYERALAMAREAREACPSRWEARWLEAELLLGAGRAPDRWGSPLHEALTLARGEGDDQGVALCAWRSAWLRLRGGDLEGAAELAEEAIEAARAASDGVLEASAHSALAGVRLAQGRILDAVDRYERASELLEGAQSPLNALRLRLNLADAHWRLGHAHSVLEVYGSVFEACQDRVEDPAYREMRDKAALAIGHIHMQLYEDEDALSWYDRLSDSSATWGHHAWLARAQIALRSGQTVRARAGCERALASAHDPPRVWASMLCLSEVELAEGATDRARRRASEVLDAIPDRGHGETRWLAHRLRGLARLESGDAGALDDLRRAVEIVEALARDQARGEANLRFMRSHKAPFVELAMALLGDDDAMASPERVDEVLRLFNAMHGRALGRGPSESEGAAESMSTVRQSLTEGEAILAFMLGEDNGVLLVVTRDEAFGRRIPGHPGFAEDARAYRSALTRPLRSAPARLRPMEDFARSKRHAEALGSRLFDRLAPRLAGLSRLYVIPDGDLALIPVAALPYADGRGEPGFLGDAFETARLSRIASPRSGGETLVSALVAGDPLEDPAGRFPPLPGAAGEVRDVAAAWSRAKPRVLTKGALTRASLERELGNPTSILHLATHAVASTSDPARCALQLSAGESLSLDEVSRLSLKGSLVVLSACRTGEGELVPGQGVVGLTWAFLRAGASGVVMSLWSVDDAATRSLMRTFHGQLASGVHPASALAEARRATRQSYPHPAYWAPFELVAGKRASDAREEKNP